MIFKEIVTVKNYQKIFKMVLNFYHTQEHRGKYLENPIICRRDNAWLGEAYYFWESEDDAHFWGVKMKHRTGKYDVYKAEVSMADVLDTVFNREQYNFWLKHIEKAAKVFIKKTNLKPSLKEINDYFIDKGIWTKFDGILFQDISNNPVHFIVKEFQYKKRIQLALFDVNKMCNFAPHFSMEC